MSYRIDDTQTWSVYANDGAPPASDETKEFREDDHPRDDAGRFTDGVPTSGGTAESHLAGGGEGLNADGSAREVYQRPVPIQVQTVEEAIPLILAGKVVELRDVRQVNTVLTKLAKIAEDAKAKGDKAPNYDLCQVSVSGSNLFCGSKLRTDDFPNGVPRIDMPQLGGFPVPGSLADALPRSDNGEVNGAVAFISHLNGLGIKTSRENVPAAKLKASQAELKGVQVAQMMTDTSYHPAAHPIFISRDNYVIDGHHRWAAVVGRDAADGKLGSLNMKTIRVDAPISEILHLANKWSLDFGIAPKSKRAAIVFLG